MILKPTHTIHTPFEIERTAAKQLFAAVVSFAAMKWNYAFFVGAWVALTACEGNTRQVYSVLNESSGPVTVVHAHSAYTDGLDLDTVTIPAGVSSELGMEDWLGGREYPDLPSSFIDTLLIFDANGVACSKDWSSMTSWDIVSTQDRKIPSQWRHEYTLAIGDEDF